MTTKGNPHFWRRWYKADELEKERLVGTLTLPSRTLESSDFRQHCATLINSYLVDLTDYLEGRNEGEGK